MKWDVKWDSVNFQAFRRPLGKSHKKPDYTQDIDFDEGAEDMDDAFARWPDGYQESVPGLLVEDVKRHRLGKEELQAKCKKKQ